jgi:hypothetical protein
MIPTRFHEGYAVTDLNLSGYDNAGKYMYEIWDSNFTIVDKAYHNPYKTLFEQNCNNSNDSRCNDCVLTSKTDEANNEDKVGCIFSSELTHPDNTVNNHYTQLSLDFKPYSYNLTTVSLRRTDDNTSQWVYMNDLEKSTNMAAILDGNITAIGADGRTLSNYITGCAAQDVLLWLDRNMSSPGEDFLTDENNQTIAFQQWLDSIPAPQTPEDNQGTGDMNATLAAANFFANNDENGTSTLLLDYNFKKPYNVPVNPIKVHFDTLHAASPNATSYANQQNNYIPEGNVTVDANRTFYFAKVAPRIGDDYIVTYGDKYTTSIRVDTYCSPAIDIDCNTLPGLGTSEELVNGGPTAWYRMSDHNTTGAGLIHRLNPSETGINELPMNNVTFDSNGSTAAFDLTYPSANPRPKDVIITIIPDEWLNFNPADPTTGNPTFSIHYLFQGLKWKGEGKTGHVVETQPFSGENKRINW